MTDTVRIPLLTDTNYRSWLVNICAILRGKDLWDVIQEPLATDALNSDTAKYQKAADILTPTISETVQEQLTDAEFNNAHLMLEKLKTRYTPISEQTFIQAMQEILCLSPCQFATYEEWMTRIKVLNERIDATQITFDSDKRTLLVMMIGLQNEINYHSLVQIWAATENMTGEKAMTMLREDLGRGELEKLEGYNAALYVNNPKKKLEQLTPAESSALGRKTPLPGNRHLLCEHCRKDRHLENVCWKKHPELRPDWAGGKKKEEEMESAMAVFHM
jgi:hypothetical protein